MSLYCPACDDVHTVKPGDVERIVYGLVDRLVMEGQVKDRHPHREIEYTTRFPCLLDVLERSNLYGDHDEGGNMETVQHWVSKRRHA